MGTGMYGYVWVRINLLLLLLLLLLFSDIVEHELPKCYAVSNAVLYINRIECNWEEPLFSLISIWFVSCEVRRFTLA